MAATPCPATQGLTRHSGRPHPPALPHAVPAVSLRPLPPGPSLRPSLGGREVLPPSPGQRRTPWGSERGPPPARAVGSETYWVTVTQAVSVVLGIAASAVVAGLLLRYKCWREAEEEVERLIAEGKTPGEILALAAEGLREEGIEVQVFVEQEGTEDVEKLVEVAAPVANEASLPEGTLPLQGAALGRRRRPQISE